MMKKINVRMKTVLANVSSYIKSRKLGAYKHTHCQYSYSDGCRCVIGCGMTDKQLKIASMYEDMDSGLDSDVGSIISNKVPKEEAFDLAELQNLHDKWAMSPNSLLYNTEDRKKDFFNYLNKMRKKYNV